MIRVNGSDYTSSRLTHFAGKSVDVFIGDDPRIVLVEDRQAGEQIPCECVTVGVGDAPSAEAAQKAIDERLEGSSARVKEGQERMAEFTDEFHTTELAQKATKEKPAAAPAPRKPDSENTDELSPDEVDEIWAKS